MKTKLLCTLALLASAETLAITSESIEIYENQNVEKGILETANLMDEINLLKLKLEKEKLNLSLNEERLNNFEVKNEISKYYPVKAVKAVKAVKEIEKSDPADGPFNSDAIKLLSVTSLQNMNQMVVFSFYGRKYNRVSGDNFKGYHVSIDNNQVTFKYGKRSYNFDY